MSAEFEKEIAGLGITRTELSEMIQDVVSASDALKNAPAADIINNKHCWNLVDTSLSSTKHMSDDELAMALVEDMLNVVQWRMDGKETGGNRDHYVRFLSGSERDRALLAFENSFVKSLIMEMENGVVELSPEYMQDAMDFCGVWLEGWEPLTDETVYRANGL